jgi:hypothetical protein
VIQGLADASLCILTRWLRQRIIAALQSVGAPVRKNLAIRIF